MGCSNSHTKPDDDKRVHHGDDTVKRDTQTANPRIVNKKGAASRIEKRKSRKGGCSKKIMHKKMQPIEDLPEENIILNEICGVLADGTVFFEFKHITNQIQLDEFKAFIPESLPCMESVDKKKPSGSWVKNDDEILLGTLYVDFEDEDIIICKAAMLESVSQDDAVAVCLYEANNNIRDNEYYAYIVDGKFKELRFVGEKSFPIIEQRIMNEKFVLMSDNLEEKQDQNLIQNADNE